MPNPTYQLPRDSTMQGIVTQLQTIASRMNNSGSGSGGSGGGSTVVANPSGTASDDLTSIEIDGTVYDIPSGSGSSYDDTALRALIAAKQDALTPGTGIQISNGTISCTVQGGSGSGGVVAEETVLYTNSGTSRESFTLSDDYTNYDQLKIIVERNNSGTIIESPANLYDTSEIANAVSIQVYWFGSEYAAFSVPTTDPKTTFTLLGGDGIGYIKKVIGIKYVSGSGSGSSSGDSSFELICEQATIQSTQTLTHSMDSYDAILINAEAFDSSTGYQSTSLTVLENIAVGKNIGVSTESGVVWFTVQSMSSLSLGYHSGDWRNLKIYGVKFGSAGGSSGTVTARRVDHIYTNSAREIQDTVTLSHPYTDYDYLVIEISDIAQYTHRRQPIVFLKEQLDDAKDNGGYITYYQSADAYAEYAVTNTTTLTKARAAYECITDIYGVKEASGGNSELPSGSGYEATLIYDGSALSSLQSSIELDEEWDNYDAIAFAVNFASNQSKTSVTFYKDMLTANIGKIVGIAGFATVYAGATVNSDKKTFSNIYGGGDIQNIYAVYGLKFGSGGSSAEGTLTEVEGYSEETLWTGTASLLVSSTVNLSEAYTDYDALRFEYNAARGDNNGRLQCYERTVSKSTLAQEHFIISDFYLWNNVGVSSSGTFTDSTTLVTLYEGGAWFQSCTLTKVVGIKYGSGGNAVTSVVEAIKNLENNVPKLVESAEYGDTYELVSHFYANSAAESHWTYSNGYGWANDELTEMPAWSSVLESKIINRDANGTITQSSNASISYSGNGVFDLNFSTSVDTWIYVRYMIPHDSTITPNIVSTSENLYSLAERVIGKWVDGKPIYRKVYYSANGFPQWQSVALDVSDLNIELLIRGDTVNYAASNNSVSNLSTLSGIVNRQMWIELGTGSLYLVMDDVKYIILEYTKTTD